LEPLRRTLESAIKLDPLTVRVKSGPSSRIDVGLRELIEGIGLPAGLMVKVTGGEVSSTTSPSFNTVICAVPAAAMSVAGMTAVSWTSLTKVVALAAPFHWTVDVGRRRLNPLPFTVRVN
jgi:hypothetical protein